MRAALYARYSSDLQNARSADDQLAALRQILALRGWIEAAAYRDEGISAAAIATRPGVQTLLSDGIAGRFDVVVVEALDRLSRDQEGTAHLYKRLTHAGVAIETLTEGRIGVMHVGLAGTMNQLFLEQLAHKTRRGQLAVVQAGRSGGGRCYGYDPVDGRPGELAINEGQAEIIRRIHRDYAAGQTPKTIARALNAEGIPGPRGGTWSPSAIAGDRTTGDGILCQELYTGVRVFNRRRFRKDPDTGRRSGVLNPPEAWVRTPVPELAILPPDAWEATQAALQAHARPQGSMTRAKRATRLLSGGIMRCGLCKGPMSLKVGRYVCGAAQDRGTCTNNKRIKCQTVEARVIDGAERHLLSPEAISAAVRRHHEDQIRAHAEALRERAPIERELAELNRRIDRAADSYERGVFELEELAARVGPLKARRAELQDRLAIAAESPPAVRLHPKAAEFYGALAGQLHQVLQDDDAGEVRDALRNLIEGVEFYPRAGLGDFRLYVHGKLAALLGISERAAGFASTAGRGAPECPGRPSHPGGWEVELGAGAGSGHNVTPGAWGFAA